MVDTGAIYRAVALAALRAGIGWEDDAALAEAIRAGRLDDHPGLRALLIADTRDRLLVANPRWLPPETRT